MRRRTPYWNLSIVQELARDGHVWLSKTRALELFETDKDASTAARSAIASLTAADFAETVLLIETMETYDVYGLTIRSRGWYLKFAIDGNLLILSFHPLVRALRVNKGLINP